MADAATTLPPGGATLSTLAAGAAGIGGPSWLVDLRRRGAARFAVVGLPTSRNEEWRFTPVQGIGALDFVTPAVPTLDPAVLAGRTLAPADAPRVVLVDGRFDPSLSQLSALPDGARAGSLAEAIAAGDTRVAAELGRHAGPEVTPFAALNAALFTDGLYLHVPAGVAVAQPIHVVHVATGRPGTLVVPRSLMLVDRGGSASIVEEFIALGTGEYFTNAGMEITLGAGARLEHVRVQREALAAWHVGVTVVDQDRDSHYRSFTLALGGRLARHDLQARLRGTNVETLLYGLYLGRGEQLLDNHTAIFHDQPNCRSWEVYKGVLAERAHGVFNGKVIVQPEAQRTDAKQTNRNLLLSDHAKVDTKPQLEIFADDVKCTHGATVGKVDAQQRYYLNTRGIAGRTAEALLIWAFAAEVLLEVTDDALRARLEQLVHAQLDALIA